MKTLFTDVTGFVPELNGSLLTVKGVPTLTKELEQMIKQNSDLYEIPTKFKDYANKILKDLGIPFVVFISSYRIVRGKEKKGIPVFEKMSKCRVYRLYWRTITDKNIISNISTIHNALTNLGFSYDAIWQVNELELQRLLIDTRCTHYINELRTLSGLLEKVAEIPMPPMKPEHLYFE